MNVPASGSGVVVARLWRRDVRDFTDRGSVRSCRTGIVIFVSAANCSASMNRKLKEEILLIKVGS